MAPTVRLTPRSKDSKCNGSRPSPFGSFDRARADDFEKDRPATLPSFVRAKLGTIDVPVVRRSCCDGKRRRAPSAPTKAKSSVHPCRQAERSKRRQASARRCVARERR